MSITKEQTDNPMSRIRAAASRTGGYSRSVLLSDLIAILAALAEAEKTCDEHFADAQHFHALAVVDPGANPPVFWKDRAADIAVKLAEAEARLPAEMPGCTIRFKECEKGYGWLTADNWVQQGCPTCALRKAEAERDEARAEAKANRRFFIAVRDARDARITEVAALTSALEKAREAMQTMRDRYSNLVGRGIAIYDMQQIDYAIDAINGAVKAAAHVVP